MMDNVFYQGETIPVVISGDDTVDLREREFMMLVYPQYENNKVVEYKKQDFVEEVDDGNLRYRCLISHEKSKEMPVGDYVIEVMIAEGNGYRSVYQRLRAFTLRFSNFKNKTYESRGC